VTIAQAPAKLILSGEHAVVYGYPALAMAINQYARVTILPQETNAIHFSFVNLNIHNNFTWKQLVDFKKEILQRRVLQHPNELLQYAFIYFAEALSIKNATGIEIVVDSSLPIGCGLGSSATTVVSLLHAVCNYYALKVALDDYLVLCREVESLQHGTSSGLDLFMSIHGGYYFCEGQKFMPRALPFFPFDVINTGKPSSTTGEAVHHAASFFKNSSSGADFAEVTSAMDLAIKGKNFFALLDCMRENHRLLQHIGVVPAKVSQFVAQIEELGGAAKISGAGAVRGDNAGVVIALGGPELKQLVAKYGYTIMHVQSEKNGVSII
jgi:mevalonate kinase